MRSLLLLCFFSGCLFSEDISTDEIARFYWDYTGGELEEIAERLSAVGLSRIQHYVDHLESVLNDEEKTLENRSREETVIIVREWKNDMDWLVAQFKEHHNTKQIYTSVAKAVVDKFHVGGPMPSQETLDRIAVIADNQIPGEVGNEDIDFENALSYLESHIIAGTGKIDVDMKGKVGLLLDWFRSDIAIGGTDRDQLIARLRRLSSLVEEQSAVVDIDDIVVFLPQSEIIEIKDNLNEAARLVAAGDKSAIQYFEFKNKEHEQALLSLVEGQSEEFHKVIKPFLVDTIVANYSNKYYLFPSNSKRLAILIYKIEDKYKIVDTVALPPMVRKAIETVEERSDD